MTTTLRDSMVGGSSGGLGVAGQHALGACYIPARWAKPGTLCDHLPQSDFPVERTCLRTMGTVGLMVLAGDAVGSVAWVDDRGDGHGNKVRTAEEVAEYERPAHGTGAGEVWDCTLIHPIYGPFRSLDAGD